MKTLLSSSGKNKLWLKTQSLSNHQMQSNTQQQHELKAYWLWDDAEQQHSLAIKSFLTNSRTFIMPFQRSTVTVLWYTDWLYQMEVWSSIRLHYSCSIMIYQIKTKTSPKHVQQKTVASLKLVYDLTTVYYFNGFDRQILALIQFNSIDNVLT